MPRKRKNFTDGYNRPFATALRTLMAEHGTTQQTLADVLGVSRQQISAYCAGSSEPGLDGIAMFAEYFGVPHSAFFCVIEGNCDNENIEKRFPVFAKRLSKLRGDISKTEFSEILGLSRQTVGFYLNGDRIPDIETLALICKKTGASADWLIGLSDDSKLDLPKKKVAVMVKRVKSEGNYGKHDIPG